MENNILIKKEKGYVLINEVQPIASTLSPNRGSKLSLKNCQEIELGYDLDMLACNEIRIDISVVEHIDSKRKEKSSPCIPLNEGGCVGSNLYNQVKGFEKGFQKALEIIGDKKFSEEDMIKAIKLARIKDTNPKNTSAFLTLEDEIIQSLQQTEWNVIVEMEEVSDGLDEKAQHQYSKQPKLDADGCLILKRK
jgi:hypothetical protein